MKEMVMGKSQGEGRRTGKWKLPALHPKMKEMVMGSLKERGGGLIN